MADKTLSDKTLADKTLTEKIEDNDRIFVITRYLTTLLRTSRPLAYASEIGEAVRPHVPRYLVNTLYGLSIGYVGLDIAVHTYNTYKHTNNKKITMYECLDKTIWHTGASIIFPAVTIHSIVKYSGKFIDHTNIIKSVRTRKFLPSILGLSSIFFVVHPIDHFTDFLMDNTFRKLKLLD
jgi:fission process protein 1